jgi:hypothetical protein
MDNTISTSGFGGTHTPTSVVSSEGVNPPISNIPIIITFPPISEASSGGSRTFVSTQSNVWDQNLPHLMVVVNFLSGNCMSWIVCCLYLLVSTCF